MNHLSRRLLSEALGTAFLLMAVVGSGIMATRLTDDGGIQLLVNAVATAAALTTLILAFGPVSGAHFNPVVTLADRCLGGVDSTTAAGYVIAQLGGAVLGVIVANLMFDLPIVELSTRVRSGSGPWLGEVVATSGLLVVVLGVARSGRPHFVSLAVGSYIGAAYFFTSSTSFANPAVTLARTLTDSFAGIAPSSVPAFVTAQLVGMGAALAVAMVLFPPRKRVASAVVAPNPEETE